MLKSMTGFGRGKAAEAGLSVTIEMKSVNHRYLDINVRVPRTYVFCEEVIKKIIKEKISRGKIEVFVTVEEDYEVDYNVEVNKGLALGYKEAFQELSQVTGIGWNEDLKTIALMNDVLVRKANELSEEQIISIFEKATEEAVVTLEKMREKEGSCLWQNIESSCKEIENAIAYLETREQEVKEGYFQRLKAKMEELLEDRNIDESRILMECAIFSDKICIDEEFARLKSHIGQMYSFEQSKGPIGKKMDFLTQEMNREANTMASKSSDIDMTGRILDIKSSVEKIREQVQNIE